MEGIKITRTKYFRTESTLLSQKNQRIKLTRKKTHDSTKIEKAVNINVNLDDKIVRKSLTEISLTNIKRRTKLYLQSVKLNIASTS